MKSVKEIEALILAPPKSEYEYFTTFEKDPILFTEGIRALVEAADCLWLIHAVINHQRNMCLDTCQVWKISSRTFGVAARGYNAVLVDGIPADEELAVDDYFQHNVFPSLTVSLWLINGLIMLPSEHREQILNMQ